MTDPTAWFAPLRSVPESDSASGVWSRGWIVVWGVFGLAALGWIVAWQDDGGRGELAALLEATAAAIAVGASGVRAVRATIADDRDAPADQLTALAAATALAGGEPSTALLVTAVVTAGHVLEDRSLPGVSEAIESLKRLTGDEVRRVTDGREEIRPLAELRPGDVVAIRPGEPIPADGTVELGRATLEESSVTGESAPREVGPGDRVFAGTCNRDGLLRVRADSVGSSTVMGRATSMFASVVESKPGVARIASEFARRFTPLALLAAASTTLITGSASRGVAVLLAACPCALVLAAPAATIAALAVAGRRGILIRNARFLESLADADVVVFDKTGTLTHGRLSLVEAAPADGSNARELLAAARRCAAGSRHPVAAALLDAHPPEDVERESWCESAGECEIGAAAADLRYRESVGLGIACHAEDRVWRLGRPEWLVEQGIATPRPPAHSGSLAAVAVDSRFLGFLLLADEVRPELESTLAELRRLGVRRHVLLTGDRRSAAEAVVRGRDFDDCLTERLPDEKLEAVLEERRRGGVVAVVGDGVNDVPALAGAHVGVALTTGAAAAAAAADVGLRRDDLRLLPEAVRLAQAARRTVAQNLIGATTVSVALFVGAAAGIVSPILAAVLHHAGSLFVVLNSARLLRSAGRPYFARDDVRREVRAEV